MIVTTGTEHYQGTQFVGASQRNSVMWQLLATRQSCNAKTEMLGWPLWVLLNTVTAKHNAQFMLFLRTLTGKHNAFGKYLGASQRDALSNCNLTQFQDPKSNIC